MQTTNVTDVEPMRIMNPVWNSKDSSYMFQISGSPRLELSIQSIGSSAGENVPVPQPERLESFLDEFIEKTSRHFATPLRTSTILPRLKHKWVLCQVAPDTHYMFTWSPTAMIIKSKEFCLVWSSVASVCSPIIPSDFLNLSAPSRSSSPARDLRTIQIQPPTATMVEHDVPMALDARMLTLEYENSPLSAEKKRVREARLRAALANLRADRLAEKYYQKYGTPAGDGSSELSSESEDEDQNENRRY